MERHLAKNAITEPLEALFAGLSESIGATNAGLVLPTSDELFEPMPKVRVVDKRMFPEVEVTCQSPNCYRITWNGTLLVSVPVGVVTVT
ncbi:MAG TPA: hypothetical protein VK763_15580 [Terriglobales bacterium]|jgi:hypothetical protein|nr:hypothetical protein [Terriglobales bacterium]